MICKPLLEFWVHQPELSAAIVWTTASQSCLSSALLSSLHSCRSLKGKQPLRVPSQLGTAVHRLCCVAVRCLSRNTLGRPCAGLGPRFLARVGDVAARCQRHCAAAAAAAVLKLCAKVYRPRALLCQEAGEAVERQASADVELRACVAGRLNRKSKDRAMCCRSLVNLGLAPVQQP